MIRRAIGALLLVAFARWALRPLDEDDSDDIHVYPTYGREHAPSRGCWCHPTMDKGEPHVLVHRVMS